MSFTRHIGGGRLLIDFAAMEDWERCRRWRAAFGKPGACEDCKGSGKTELELGPHDDVERGPAIVDCDTCMGTGRGEHVRGGG